MGELILIRHGETEWSRNGQHTSHTDLPLTPLGERQARALAPLLADRHIALTLVSPSVRARRTAELAGLSAPRITPELREWDYGGYEGITTQEIHLTRPSWNLWSDGVAAGPEAHPGETPEAVGERADRILAEVREAAGRVRRRGHRPRRPLPLPPRPDGPLPRPDSRRGHALPARHGRRVPARQGARPAGHHRVERDPAGEPVPDRRPGRPTALKGP